MKLQIDGDLTSDQAFKKCPTRSKASSQPPHILQKQGYKLGLPSQPTTGPFTLASRPNVKVDNTDTPYMENAKWSAILDKIDVLKNFIEEDSEVDEERTVAEGEATQNGPELLFRGGCQDVKKSDILAAIPPRPKVDQLIFECFDSAEIAPVILHRPTFLNDYERFWKDPEATPVLWLGQLFAMMGLAVAYQQLSFTGLRSSQPTIIDPEHQIQIYGAKVSQCLIIGGYTSGAPYTVETLLLYVHMEILMKNHSESGVWVLLGIVLRLAFRMGYHRDSAQNTQITPFQSEMRRRVWAVIFMMDATVSAQYDLPRVIRASQSSTQEPRSFLDDDIWEHMARLPIPRPDSVPTPIQFLISKNKLISAFSKVADMFTLIKQPQYAEILRLDGILQSAFDTIPQWLTMRSVTQSIMDGPHITMQRAQTALIFYKAKCILHRPFILKAKEDTRHIYSRTVCLEAALEILKIQESMDQEARIGGQLHETRGRILHLMQNDFLLATNILCVDVSHTLSQSAGLHSQNLENRLEPEEETIKALNGAYLTWVHSSELSQEAHHAASATKGVLEKVKKWSAGKLVVESPRTLFANSVEEDITQRNDQVADSLLSDDPESVNARVTASNPTFFPYFPERAAMSISGDFEMVSSSGLATLVPTRM